MLLDEVVAHMKVKEEGKYVDGTLGLGGHAEAILKRLGHNGRLLGLDVDRENLGAAERRLQPFGNLTITRQVNFRGLHGVLRDLNWSEVDGMLFDLGVSSVHLDDPARGFSFREDGPMDMRLDKSQPETALTLLRHIDEKKLEETIRNFGEPRHARRLARELLRETANGAIKTTGDAARLCERVIGRHGKTHPATRVFLALRSLVNDEEGALNDLLNTAPEFLAPNGRMLVISFHSGEDRMVKHSFRAWAAREDGKQFEIITKKPIEATETEQRDNPRSRSAKLRVLERVA